jgi:hypothetical protein
VTEETITVQLTPKGSPTQHYVVEVKDNKVYIDAQFGIINTYFIVHAERKDIEKVLLEYKTIN